MTLLAGALALVVGLTLGLLGGGGSILTVPAIVYSMGIDPKTAVVMSLPIVGGAAFVGALRQVRMGNVDLPVAVPFGLTTMLGAYGGAWIGRALDGSTQLAILAVVMLLAAISMLRSQPPREPAPMSPHRVTPQLLVIGLATGVLTGVVGIGGGFLLVPALVLIAGVSMHKAVGTSLLVIAMNTAAGYAGYHTAVAVRWDLVLWFGGIASAGILIGSALVPRVPQAALRRAFALLLLVVASSMVWQGLTG
jgi:uncharacterized membrane protein YfcA